MSPVSLSMHGLADLSLQWDKEKLQIFPWLQANL